MTRNRTILIVAALLFCLILASAAVLAAVDAPTVDWWVFGSGGAKSTAANIVLVDTIGQPISGPSSAVNIELNAGFQQRLQDALSRIYLPAVQSAP